jgi:hypothetical protein
VTPQRGVYFDAWFPRQHCYHPSLPPRRLRMLDDLADYHATTLVWAALGGGSIALPYLEREAFGPVDARARFYGFVNDSEFIAAAQERGIAVFGIVFEAQGWELPVELSEDEDEILALNELRGAGRRDRIGLREFGRNRFPKLWKPVEHYFPDGLVNSDGEKVTDLIDECCARDIHGNALHARWVECPDREHECFYMDRNNPVWREYLKAVIRIQIDAGVDGVQLDESELPIGSFQYGGCFCKDCMKGFRAYLGRPAGFHYGEWLLERGYDFRANQIDTPLYREYHRFQCDAIRRHFHELADYARSYAREHGREIRVSGNFFNMDPQYLALADDVDVIVTEMRNTTDRQPEWYRYVAGFARGKDVIVVENPYGGVVPDLAGKLGRGKGYDLLRLSLFEAAAMGVNMAVPYGSWMGATIQDSFHPPHALLREIQDFLAGHEDLFSRVSGNDAAVVYDVAGNFELVARADVGDNLANARDETVVVPYRTVVRRLAGAGIPFDVVLFPDGVTAPDRVTAGDLRGHDPVILPAGADLTAGQVAALHGYLAGGGHLVHTGDLREPSLLAHPGVREAAPGDLDGLLPSGRQIEIAGSEGRPSVRSGAVAGRSDVVATNIMRLPDGRSAVHVVNYGYDAEEDRVRPLDTELTVRLSRRHTQASVYHCDGRVAVPAVRTGEGGHRHTVALDRLGPYAIVVFG